ncbi:MAG: class I SAM-dependent methyltransferase [Chitinivibrionales bacterium]|nr:class I SAM-dependent methyltransferase [Chitinivibrionales bacterium]
MNTNIDRNYYGSAYYQGHIDRISRRDRFTAVKVRRTQELLQPQPGELIVDLGCGAGTMMIFMAGSGARMIGVDYSTVSLSLAREQFTKRISGKPFFGVCCDGRSIPLREATIDAIMAVDFTEHLDDSFLQAMLMQAYRILKPGGRMVIYTPNPTHIFERLKKHNVILKEDKSHIGLRSMQAYVKACTARRFKIEQAYFEPTHIPGFSLLERICMALPFVGDFAKRRICLLIRK